MRGHPPRPPFGHPLPLRRERAYVTRSVIAYTSGFVHAIATLLMAVVLAPGLTGNTAYIAEHRSAWTASWIVWQIAALSLVALYACFSQAAALIATAGAAVDITSEWRYILSGPSRALDVAIGGVANGLYTIGLIVILTRRDLPRGLRIVGAAVAIAGIAMSAGAFANMQPVEIAATATLFPLFIVWAILAGRWFQQESA
jgi:hypothetical protein